MSQFAAQAFLESVQRNTALQQRLEKADSFTETVHIGEELGYNFTIEEYISEVHRQWSMQQQERELSEEELQAVAGGVGTQWPPITAIPQLCEKF